MTEKINTGLDKELPSLQQRLIQEVGELLDSWWVTDTIARVVDVAVRKILESLRATANRIRELMEGVLAPFLLYDRALEWQGGVRSAMGTVASATHFRELKAPDEWEGRAAERYKNSTARQSGAAEQVGVIADTVGQALTVSAAAGGAFYLALAAIVAKFISLLVAASAATATGVGAPVGIGAAAATALTTSAYVGAAVAALVTLLTAQAQTFTDVQAEARDPKAFGEDGRWPKGTV
ncbi:hypothetical protein ACFQVC_32930 [Streptomyces monticola]|uniref:WXG100 family type VII secretion target n=1 Tax=Streptomyces monticola TaxID=2666263 RepID=A0ABW2JT08_9ACTN